jgi:predicted aspartyl protease
MRNVEFVDTGFTGQTYLIVVQYPENKIGPPNNSRFRSQGDIVKVSRM